MESVAIFALTYLNLAMLSQFVAILPYNLISAQFKHTSNNVWKRLFKGKLSVDINAGKEALITFNMAMYPGSIGWSIRILIGLRMISYPNLSELSFYS